MTSMLRAVLMMAIAAAALYGVATNLAAQGTRGASTCSETYSIDRRTGKPAPFDCSRPVVDQAARLKGFITGGEGAPDERHTAAIFFLDENKQPNTCTGILLDAHHVLTAAHCGCGLSGSYRVVFSEFAQQGAQPNEEIRITRAPILFDPMACIRGISPGNDLALLELEERKVDNKNEFGYPVFALAADYREKMKPSMSLKVVGYGETETGGSGRRMKASVPIVTPDCFGPPYNLHCAPFQEMILADRSGSRVPRDSCEGDSGGPVFVEADVTLPECTGNLPGNTPPRPIEFEPKVTGKQDVLIAVTSRPAPFTQPLVGGHCGGGGTYTLIGRRPVYAWFEQNHVNPQKCVVKIR
jgi:hypothetical protein